MDFQQVDWHDFLNALRFANRMLELQGKGHFVQVRSAYVYKPSACFLNKDRTTGFVVTEERELLSLFNFGPKGQGKLAVQCALEKGAVDLDCDLTMVTYYQEFGFKVVNVGMSLLG